MWRYPPTPPSGQAAYDLPEPCSLSFQSTALTHSFTFPFLLPHVPLIISKFKEWEKYFSQGFPMHFGGDINCTCNQKLTCKLPVLTGKQYFIKIFQFFFIKHISSCFCLISIFPFYVSLVQFLLIIFTLYLMWIS